MLKIRLSRQGAKKRPFYHIVVANQRSSRDGQYIELLGTFNPMVEKNDPKRVNLKTERAQYWLKTGAQPTERVAKLLAALNLVQAPVQRETPKRSTPKTKAQERAKAAAEKAAAAAPAA